MAQLRVQHASVFTAIEATSGRNPAALRAGRANWAALRRNCQVVRQDCAAITTATGDCAVLAMRVALLAGSSEQEKADDAGWSHAQLD